MSHECHLLIKGAKNQKTFIMDSNLYFIWWSQFLPASPLIIDVSGAISEGVNEQSRMWETRVSRHENTSMPPMRFLLPPSDWSLCSRRRLVFWLVLLLFSPRASVRVSSKFLSSLRPDKTGAFCAGFSDCHLRSLSLVQFFQFNMKTKQHENCWRRQINPKGHSHLYF